MKQYSPDNMCASPDLSISWFLPTAAVYTPRYCQIKAVATGNTVTRIV